ncbi:SDR family NAD(P)-dependent oxidoreductase [Mucilaginibacter polytrichastri]|uniref:Bacilysin biosynthesis oxidoreductase BacC n=1 Tax=Mucilaginibacter polytrichastri TaxID=1302689 RepID=A0A1Q6A2I9_9SPHI|nr:SDR family oxidoreductase [Mucilaginibacter polytrichastri]OKS88226.1 Bacilysin biosynthesis oxidoreductase BacC [Mucilaginibacter polytrichastri]SFT08058.1 NAD(P)-dependent dehydrogenase, short-chain alcohol dehydrogenase family [Mucilaginibacter polytrichastri]
MRGLTKKTALITGGASGLGKAIAERLTEEGATVVIADLNEDAGKELAEKLKGYFIKTNVTDAASVEAAVAYTVEKAGKLDIFVNNAGIDGAQAPTHESTLENWHKVIDINLNGAFYGLKYALTQFVKQNTGGTIINTVSIVGMVGFANIPPYTATKAALINLTRSTAVEYGKYHIRVNAVAPTTVLTPLVQHFIDSAEDPAAMKQHMETMNPIPGIPEAADIAATVAFLASDDAKFITGITIAVDGGYTAQ